MTNISRDGFINTRSIVLFLVVTVQLGLAAYLIANLHAPVKHRSVQFSREEKTEPEEVDVLTDMHKDILLKDTDINAYDWKVQPQFFQYLRRRPRKDIVNFQPNSLADDSVVECLRGYNLSHLSLFTNHLTRRILPIIYAMSNLHMLEFQSLGLVNDDLKELIKLKRLRSLRACGANLSDEGMRILSEHSFSWLVLPANPKVTDKGVAFLAHEPLQTINLSGSGITDNCLPVLSRIKSLEVVELAQTKLTDKSLPYFEKLPRLQKLDLRGTLITDSGLGAFKPPTNLDFLRVRFCKSISRKAVMAFKERNPTCQVESNFK
ncbi:MAG TPA: hypothetical protein V6C72_04895 [Chroococcales cyanobacterium]